METDDRSSKPLARDTSAQVVDALFDRWVMDTTQRSMPGCLRAVDTLCQGVACSFGGLCRQSSTRIALLHSVLMNLGPNCARFACPALLSNAFTTCLSHPQLLPRLVKLRVFLCCLAAFLQGGRAERLGLDGGVAEERQG